MNALVVSTQHRPDTTQRVDRLPVYVAESCLAENETVNRLGVSIDGWRKGLGAAIYRLPKRTVFER